MIRIKRYPPRYFNRAYLIVFALILALFLICCSTSDPPNWKTVLDADAKQQNHEDPPTVITANQIIIYLDTSASMAGYVSSDRQGQTVFSRTLQELRNLTTILNPPSDVLVRHVDLKVGQPLNDADLSTASINPGLYTGRETDLAGAISLLPKPVISQPQPGNGDDQEASERPSPPARFHILVTDGVQSTTQQNPNLSCVAGSDQVCVRKRILELLNQGWGASVIGLRSEFKGKLYSEVSHTSIPYDSGKRDVNKFRPFYIYLFSPDRGALNQLIDVLRERLHQLVGQEDALRELSLTAPYTEGFVKSTALVPSDQANSIELSRAREENPPRLTLRINVNTERTGPANFTVNVDIPWSKHAIYMGTPRERAQLVRWDLVPVYPTENMPDVSHARYPELSVAKQEIDENGQTHLLINAQWPRGTGNLKWRVYRLEGHLNLEQQTPAWVQQWSTNLDTTVEAGNKTLNLESVLLGLWRNDVLKSQTVAQAYLRVGPQ